jgi:glucose-6-phosphate 1-dehydrogenase
MDKTDEIRNLDSATMAETTTPDMGIPFKSCLIEGTPDPCMVVIVGASGDLTARKIVPALFNLFLNDGLPDPFLVVGCARTKLSSQEFRDKMKNALKTANILDDQKWQDFSKSLYYQAIDYDELPSFKALARSLRELDKKHGTGGNRVFYLAIPPSLYKSTAQMLGKAGLSVESEKGNSWARIVV